MEQQDANYVSVGLGELKVSQDPAVVLVAHGLGSCVGVCAYDPIGKVGGLLHAMLPESNGRDAQRPTKYVDTGIQKMLDELAAQGALRSRIVFRMAGGAQMLNAPGFKNVLNIGARNIEAAETVFREERLRLSHSDTGGHYGRTVKLHIGSGVVRVRSAGKGEHELLLE